MGKYCFLLLILAWNFLGAIPPELRGLDYAVYPTSPQYNTARFNFNKRFNVFPKAIFAPTEYSQAAFVLSALKKHHLPFSVRSGGHCFEPGSLSSGYIIDLRNFNSINPNPDKNEVFIGAGCILGDVIKTLGEIDYAIPTGTCPTVGAAGLTMGGGIGLLVRTFGLTCDSVKSVLLLTAESKIITVSADHHPDLFWALLGGGSGSYGIVLGFTFTMYYIPEVTFYELIWEWDTRKIIPVMEAWQTWVKTLPDNISSVCGLRHPNDICALPHETPPIVIRVFGLKVGSEPFVEWKSAFEGLKPKVNIFQGTYLDMSKYWVAEPMLPFNKAKSRILMEPVTYEVLKKVTCFFEEVEEEPFLVYFNFESLGGKVPQNETAFFPRDAFGWWFQAYYWARQEQTDAVLAISRDFYNKIPSEVSKYCFANIIDYDLGRYYMEAYYGSNAGRLIDIKRKYDPANLFHWKQSIPLTKAVPGSLICQ